MPFHPIFQPITFLSQLFIKIIIRRFNLPSLLLTVFTSLFSFTRFSLSNIGIISSLRVLWNIRRFINNPSINILGIIRNISPQVADQFQNNVYRMLRDCLSIPGYLNPLNRLFNFYFFIYFLKLFNPIIIYLFRSLFALIISAVAIIGSDLFSSYPAIKNTAYSFIENVNNFIKQIIPNSIITSPVIIDTNMSSSDSSKINNYLDITNILIIISIGAAFYVATICLMDSFYPESTKQIPFSGHIIDTVHGIYNSIINYINPRAPDGSGSSIPSQISRSLSNESDITIRAPHPRYVDAAISPINHNKLPTPPSTPEPDSINILTNF